MSVHAYACRTAIAIAVTFACTVTSTVLAEGEPNLGFGTQGFVRYEHSMVVEEPNIERGLQLRRREDGALAALVDFRVQDSADENNPLIVVFDANGALMRGNLFLFASFFLPPGAALAGAFDASERALVTGADVNGFNPVLFTAIPGVSLPSAAYFPELFNQVTSDPRLGEFPRAIAGLGNGNILVCGAHRILTMFGQPLLPICRSLTRMGNGVVGFGTHSPFVSGSAFSMHPIDIANLLEGQILSVRPDRQGRILLGGMLRLSNPTQDLAFSARLLADGAFDTSYCAESVCSDAVATAPGWRADAIADTDQINKSALVERPDGAIVQVVNLRAVSAQQDASALLLYSGNGALSYASMIQLGTWTRMGTQLGAQADNKVVVPLSYRPNATTQFGAVLRVPTDPAQDGLFDPAFEYAPAGVTALPGISVIRPNLPGGAPANSVECNAVLVESEHITCAGLVRVGDAPVNLDLLLAQIRIDALDPISRDGFEN